MGFSYSSKLGDVTGIGDDGFSYNPVTDTLDVGTLTANNVVVTALATPTVTSVTPTLTQVGTINVVAGASLVDGDYFTIDYGSGTIPIEFEATPPNGTTGGRIPFTFAAGDAAGTIRDGLIALINLAAPTKVVASIGGAAAITVSMVTPGEAGGVITENVANAGFTVAGFANPTAATTYGYKAVSYLADGTSTAASTEVTTAAGHATLSASNYVTVVFAPSAGSTSTRLYRTTGGTAPPKLLYTGTATSFTDTGAAGTAQTPATVNGTGVVTAGRVLVGDGSAAAPSVAVGNAGGDTNVGFYRPSQFFLGLATSGVASLYFGSGEIRNTSTGQYNWSSTSSPAGATDLILSRGAAATLQLGAANAASPIAQTLQAQGSRGGTDTDVAGANLTIRPGAGTGAGAGSSIVFQTPTATGSGTTAQTQTARMIIDHSSGITVYTRLFPNAADAVDTGFSAAPWRTFYLSRATLGSKSKAITDGSATAFASFTIADGEVFSGEVIYAVTMTEGAAGGLRQRLAGRARFSAVRAGATITATVNEVGTQLLAAGSGTLTGSISIAGAAGVVTLSANFDTSQAGPDVFKIDYRFDSPDAALAITPL